MPSNATDCSYSGDPEPMGGVGAQQVGADIERVTQV